MPMVWTGGQGIPYFAASRCTSDVVKSLMVKMTEACRSVAWSDSLKYTRSCHGKLAG